MKNKRRYIAIFKTILGGILPILGIVFVLLGRDEYYGYLNEHPLAVVAFACIVGISGFFILGSYSDYLDDEINGRNIFEEDN